MKAAAHLLWIGIAALPVNAAGQSSPLLTSDRPCHMAVEQTPDADVAYQPGIDAQGQAVTPADINGGEPPPELHFDLETPLLGHTAVGGGRARDLSQTNIPVGSVTMDASGTQVEVLGKDASNAGDTSDPCP